MPNIGCKVKALRPVRPNLAKIKSPEPETPNPTVLEYIVAETATSDVRQLTLLTPRSATERSSFG